MSEKRTLLQRFMGRINSDWQWTKGKNKPNGYGQIKYDGRHLLAHRVSYELFNGPIPEGMEVLHSCDDPGCVDPDHLHLGTQIENIEEREQRGRGIYKKGERHGVYKLTQNQADSIRKEYSAGNKTMRALAKEYKVGTSQICRIIHNMSW